MNRWVTYDTTLLTLGTGVQYVISLDFVSADRFMLMIFTVLFIILFFFITQGP